MDKQQWNEKGQDLKEILLDYNWQYRKKICTKCPLSEQKRRQCFRVDNYRIIQGEKIQETHCKWMNKARVAKFGDMISSFINVGMNMTFGTDLR